MNRRLAWLALLLSLVAAAPARAGGAEQAAFAKSAEHIVAMAKEEKVVGGALYFIDRGRIVGARHFGLADAARNQAVTADTIFHWASITKTFTAIAIMQLAERGLLGLDDPIQKYVPEFSQVHNPYGPTEQITLRHLLTHSSGLRDPTWPWLPDGDKDAKWTPSQPIGWGEVMAMMPYTAIAFPPGTRFSYSNPGYSLLGLVIEKVTGDDVEAYLDKNILRPLGMTRSYFDVTPYHLERDRSNSYSWTAGQRIAHGRDFDTGATVANGGLNAPIPDMIRYLNFLIGEGDTALYEAILPRRTLVAMWQPLHPADFDPGVDERIAQSFFTIDIKADDGRMHRFVGHTGSQEGYRAFLYLEPGTKAGAILAVNTTVDKPRPFVFEARRDLFQHVFPKAAHAR